MTAIGLSDDQRATIGATLVYLISVEAWFSESVPDAALLVSEPGVMIEMLPTARALLDRWKGLGLAEALGLNDDEDDE